MCFCLVGISGKGKDLNISFLYFGSSGVEDRENLEFFRCLSWVFVVLFVREVFVFV